MISLLKVFKIVFGLDQDFFTFYGGGKGGGGGGGSQQSTSYSTNLPEYAKPFYEELLKQSGKQIYETDSSGAVTGVKEFQPYTGDRLADFTTEQEKVQKEALGMTTPGGFQTASGTLGTVVKGASASLTTPTATDPESDTVTYSVVSGSLPTGLSLNSSTGAITGTESGSDSSSTTYSFTLRATANGKTSDRAFTILVYVTQTYTFSYTGSEQSLTVPSGVTSITVDLRGAGGGSQGAAGAGGTGGKTTGTLSVTSGDVIKIVVGGAGKLSTGAAYGGGGYYTAGNGNGGGGGGYSGLFATSVSFANSLAIAGGGGGGAYGGNSGGSGGGTTGGNSSGGDSTSTGGSQVSGGSGANSGGQLQGGTANGNGNGGAGGGGYYGGGGGSESGNDWGGGGGSGYTGGLTGASTTNAQGSSANNNGVIYLTY